MLHPIPTKGLTSGAVARAAGVNTETLRYYERRGLLPAPPRRPSGYRQYPPEAVQRIRFIKRAQELGFTLRDIETLLALRAAPDGSSADIRHAAQVRLADIEARIADLERMKTSLHALIAACDGTGPTDACPIIHALETPASL